MDFISIPFHGHRSPRLLLLLPSLRVRGASRGARAARSRAPSTRCRLAARAARVMTTHERQAYELLKRALPGYMVLAQVPLSRFVRVPTRHSYSEWLQRVGPLSADLLVCDTGSRVLAVIDVRAGGRARAAANATNGWRGCCRPPACACMSGAKATCRRRPRCAPRWRTTCCAAADRWPCPTRSRARCR
jgi:hypothetical protein